MLLLNFRIATVSHSVIISFTLFLALFSSLAAANDFSEEVEKDYPLRSIGRLQITNAKGDITIQGWALDKIRVKMEKVVTSDSPEKAKQILAGMDLLYESSHGNMELSTQYGKDLSIEQRIKLKEQNHFKTNLTISAPSNLNLRVWSVDGKVLLRTWNSKAELRTNSGLIRVEGMKGDSLSVSCTSCAAQLKNIRAPLRLLGESGPIDLNNVSGKNIYVETGSGPVKLVHLQGDQLYISKTGAIQGQFMKGKIEFHTQAASVDFREVSGFLSGTVESGDIRAQVNEWEFSDKALIEASQGSIYLTLPRHFSSELDLWSMKGTTSIDFPVEKIQDPLAVGPEPTNHLVGRVGEGGELLKLFTEAGNIYVFKGKL